MIVNGEKVKTARKPDYKITKSKRRKFLNNFKYGAFADAYIDYVEVVSLDSFDDKLARELGYSTLEEYLSNGWNSDFDERKVIGWSDLRVDWDVVRKIIGG